MCWVGHVRVGGREENVRMRAEKMLNRGSLFFGQSDVAPWRNYARGRMTVEIHFIETILSE